MTFLKMSSLILSLSAVSVARAEVPSPFSVRIESVGPLLDTRFTMGSGQVVERDWFAFRLNVRNPSATTELTLPVTAMTADFGPLVGRCQILAERVDTIKVAPGGETVTPALYCQGLNGHGSFEHVGSLHVEARYEGAPQSQSVNLPIKTN